MASTMARDGRRRRVLHDEVRTAAGAPVTAAGAADSAAPRYGEQANIEHHPQITDYVPRRKRAVLVVLAAGMTVAAGTQVLAQFAAPVAALLPGLNPAKIADQLAGGVAAWASAVALLLTAALARIAYSLRRHRVDDYRGRYRVWRWAVWAAVLASVNSVVGLHDLFGRTAAALSGWSFTAAGSEWWLTPVVVIAMWIGWRLAFELAEVRGTMAIAVMAGACYGAAAAGALGWSPAFLGVWTSALTGALPLVGHTLTLIAMMLYARYVVLDVQGLIEHAPRPAASSARVRRSRQSAPATEKSVAVTTSTSAPAAKALSAALESDDRDDDGDVPYDRPLTKAERKRLRKQHREGRAA